MKITARSNYKDRTFTIRIYRECGVTKYRTLKLDPEEFQSCCHNTQSDWIQFLKSDDYYEVK